MEGIQLGFNFTTTSSGVATRTVQRVCRRSLPFLCNTRTLRSVSPGSSAPERERVCVYGRTNMSHQIPKAKTANYCSAGVRAPSAASRQAVTADPIGLQSRTREHAARERQGVAESNESCGSARHGSSAPEATWESYVETLN